MLIKLGDADISGNISISDATTIQLHLALQQEINDAILKLADTDRNSKVSIMDATQIQLFIAQLIPEL